MAKIHPVGDFQDDCEKSVAHYLAKNLPADFHIYHNLELIRHRRGHAYEYDLIVVGRVSVWVIEVKGYRGVIRGNAASWELSNGRFERSPVPLTNEKARVLKNNIVRYAPDLNESVYVDSLVVLRFNNTKVNINDPQADRVLRLFEVPPRLLEGERQSGHSRSYKDHQKIICRMLDQWFGPLEQKKIVGDYEVLDTMVDVNPLTSTATYPARHRLLSVRSRVSLKVLLLNTSLSEGELINQREQFIREAEALNMLGEHSNVVRCYAPFLWESDKVIVPFEWVDGQSLHTRMEGGLDWTLSTRLNVFHQVCNGLAHAHSHGVIHRGICPENVLLTQNNHVKLVNFKFAKMFFLPSQKRSLTRYLLGVNRRYQAPELLLDIHAATPKSDIFSMGILFYEILTGQVPAMTEFVLSEREFHRLEISSGSIFSRIYDMFIRMCAADPDGRYNSINEILTALAKIQHDGQLV